MASLRDRRRAARVSLREAAACVGTHHPNLSLIERGLVVPKVDTVYRLARFVRDDRLAADLEEALPDLFTQDPDDGLSCRHALADQRFLDVPAVGGARICDRCGSTLKVTPWHPLRH